MVLKEIDAAIKADVIANRQAIADLLNIGVRTDKDDPIGNAILTFISFLGSSIGSLQALGAPIVELVARSAWEATPINLPDVDKLISANFRGEITDERFLKEMLGKGFNEQWSGILKKTFRQLINITELMQLKWRGDLSEADFKTQLESHGLNDADRDLFINLLDRLLPIQDVISMAVRDVFTPAAVAQGRLFENLPDELVEQGAKQGFTRQQMEWFWGAHWRIPSVLRGFEMLHRGVIDDTELNTLMTALDIAPGWREPLKEIAFKIPGRVDTRRFHAAGIWTREQVKAAYIAQGFNDEIAEFQTQFTEVLTARGQSNLPEELIGLTKSNVLQFMRLGMLDPEEAVGMLLTMGIGEATANGLIDHELIKLELKLRREQTDGILIDFKQGEITFDEATTQHELLEPTEIESQDFSNKLDKASTPKDTLPTVEQIIKMFGNKYLNETEAIEVMLRRGYTTFFARGILQLKRI